MKNDLLLETIANIQNDYLQILKRYSEVIDSSNIVFAINEIRIFWNANKRIIKFFLLNYSNNFDTCVLTCSAYLNIEENNHYPFLAFGEKHIIDDPVLNFSLSLDLNKNKDATPIFFSAIKKSIKEVMEIITNRSMDILVMPLSFLFLDLKTTTIVADKVFFSMFKNKDMNMEKYYLKNKNLKDIISNLEDYITDELFLNGDDISEPFEVRYNNYLEYSKCSYLNCDDVQKFYFTTTSMFSQIFNIIGICINFSFYPFIREENIINNFCLLIPNFKDLPNIDIISKKAIGHYILFNSFDFSLDKYPKIDLFVENLKKCNFCKILNDFLLKQKVPYKEEGSFQKIQEFILAEMKKYNFYLTKGES